jgi:hypothetical protein
MPQLTQATRARIAGRSASAQQKREAINHLGPQQPHPMFQNQDTNRPRATARPTPRDGEFTLARFIEVVKQIPDGKYALVGKDGVTVHFFEIVDTGKRNWVNRLYGAPGDFRRERMPYKWMFAAAVRIAADPRAAAVLFGKETNTCARCDSPLTKAESRARGLGPHCAKVYGM